MTKAKAYFDSGWYCAESVVTEIAEAGGLDPELPRRLASGFCSGMGRSKNMCGAVTGAIMGLNLYAGRSSRNVEIDASYELTNDLLEAFEAKYGSCNCFELTECDFNTVEGQTTFKARGLNEFCGELCDFAAETALELLVAAGYLKPEASE